MRLLTTLIATAGFAGAQVFHSDEAFYQFLENRQRMALVEAQAKAWAAAQAQAQEAEERQREELYWLPDQRVSEFLQAFESQTQ